MPPMTDKLTPEQMAERYAEIVYEGTAANAMDRMAIADAWENGYRAAQSAQPATCAICGQPFTQADAVVGWGGSEAPPVHERCVAQPAAVGHTDEATNATPIR